MKRFIHLVLASIFILLQILVSVPATAHDAPPKQPSPGKGIHSDTVPPAGEYEFITPKGRNLTLLVRRALQLYDQAHDDIVLSEPAIIYAEANIVKQLGSRQLAVNEHVKIEESLLDEYAKKSKNLNPSQTAAWQQYAHNANFNLSDINPVRTSSRRTDAPKQSQQEQTKSQNRTSVQNNRDAVKSEVRPNMPEARPRLRALWWAAGFLVIWAIYALLGRQSTNSTPK